MASPPPCNICIRATVGKYGSRKRYRRQDAIGTPYCITVDHDTLQDNQVTIRFRDTMEQERVPVDRLRDIIAEKVSMRSLLKKVIE